MLDHMQLIIHQSLFSKLEFTGIQEKSLKIHLTKILKNVSFYLLQFYFQEKAI